MANVNTAVNVKQGQVSIPLIILSTFYFFLLCVGSYTCIVIMRSLQNEDSFNDISLEAWNMCWMFLYLFIVVTYITKNKQFSNNLFRLSRLMTINEHSHYQIKRRELLLYIFYLLLVQAATIFDLIWYLNSSPEMLLSWSWNAVFFWFVWIYNFLVDAVFTVFFYFMTQVVGRSLRCTMDFIDDSNEVNDMPVPTKLERTSIILRNTEILNNNFMMSDVSSHENIFRKKSIGIVARTRRPNADGKMTLNEYLFNAERTIIEVFDVIDQQMNIFGYSILFFLLDAALSLSFSLYFSLDSALYGKSFWSYVMIFLWRFASMMMFSTAADNFNKTVSICS